MCHFVNCNTLLPDHNAQIFRIGHGIHSERDRLIAGRHKARNRRTIQTVILDGRSTPKIVSSIVDLVRVHSIQMQFRKNLATKQIE